MNRQPHLLSPSKIEAIASDWVIRRERGLSNAEQRELTQWMAAEPRHAEAMVRHDQAWALLDRPRTSGTTSKMALDLTHRATRRRRIGAITSVCLAIVIVWLVAPLAPKTSIAPSLHGPSSSPSALVTAAPMQVLPDGSVVELKSGAEIAIDFSGPLRRVMLVKGEAYFQVAKNRERPFVVTADGLEVRAVGTEFSVGLASSSVDVIVTEGRVAVEEASPAPTGQVPPSQPKPAGLLASLKAGKRLVIDRSSATHTPEISEMSIAEIADRLAWRIVRLEFSNTPLSEAVSMMNQHSRTQIVIDDPRLARTPVSGIFRADNTDTLIRLLEENFSVKVERIDNKIILRGVR